MKQSLLTVLCVVIFGCTVDDNGIGYSEEEAEYKWGKWDSPQLISIANDSLAVLAIYKNHFKIWNQCGFDGCTYLTQTDSSRVGLFLVNYIEKQKPVWGDTSEHSLTIVKDYFKDSSVLVFDRENNKFGLWKIGAKEFEFVDYEDCSGIENRKYINYNARPFENGNILLFSYPNIFLLDVEKRQLKSFEFSGEYEWLSKCTNYWYRRPYIDYVNISFIKGKASCIKRNEITNNYELTVNDTVTDSLSSLRYYGGITGWYLNYIVDDTRGGRIYKIDTLNFKFDSTTIRLLINGPSFYKNSQNGDGSVRYTTQDLLGVYE